MAATKEAYMLGRLDDTEFEMQMAAQRATTAGHWTKTTTGLHGKAMYQAQHYMELLLRDFGKANVKS